MGKHLKCLLDNHYRIFFRRWLRLRHVDVHVWLAVAFAQKLGLKLFIDDRVFGGEAFESVVENLLDDQADPTVH